MKKLAILMTLALAMSNAALANPVFADGGAEASNALYPGISGGDCDDTDRCVRPGKVKLTIQTWTDPDSDGDGLGDLTLESTEILSTNKGQIISAITSERKPKFKTGAELSKTVNSMYVGNLDGDGFGEVALDIRKEVQEKKNAYRLAGAFPKDWTLPAKVEPMNKAELIEAMANEAGLSKADAKKSLDGFIDATTKDLDRR